MTSAALDKVRFLLVDDLEENLTALEALLRREGLETLTARSGSEALELLLKHDFALALVDVQMPGMSGFELAELMRGTDRTRRVPIIFVTAGSTDWHRRFRGYEAGAVDFIQKPIEPHVLKSKADVFFDLYRQRQEVAHQRDVLGAATEENARLLAESRRHAAALKQADERKDEFLAMLAHELRNPLAPVQNAVEILRHYQTSEPDVESAREIISRQVGHMARLIDDLLDVARITQGKMQLRLEQCDLATIVKQTAEDYRLTLATARIALELSIPDTPLMLMGDPTRLAQVVGNLLHNASKFTPAGGRVALEVTADDDRRSAQIVVRDNGAGMDSDVIARLFEPFTQAFQPIDRSQGGLGLGLCVVSGLMRLHGGKASAASDGPGRGSTFTLTIPLSATAGDPGYDRTQAKREKANGSLKILIIEDNRDAARSLQLLLSILGHDVRVAYDGRAGLKSIEESRPDVVFSDLGLPGGLDGFAVAETIRHDVSLSKCVSDRAERLRTRRRSPTCAIGRV